MTTALTLPIARLRDSGCKVSTVIGHDPRIGDFIYSVRLPSGIPPVADPDAPCVVLVPRWSDGHHVAVRATIYRPGEPTPNAHDRNVAGLSAAAGLRRLADYVDSFDQAGSASRQHFIETGRYLRHDEVES